MRPSMEVGSQGGKGRARLPQASKVWPFGAGEYRDFFKSFVVEMYICIPWMCAPQSRRRGSGGSGTGRGAAQRPDWASGAAVAPGCFPDATTEDLLQCGSVLPRGFWSAESGEGQVSSIRKRKCSLPSQEFRTTFVLLRSRIPAILLCLKIPTLFLLL